MLQVVGVVTTAMVLSIQIARFHSYSRRGLMGKINICTCVGTLAENGRGTYARGVGAYWLDSTVR